MLQAQIHHKIPREFEGMEDVLTSSTIGLLGYLPSSLAAAVVAELAQIPLETETVEVALWPNYTTPPGFRASAHPDDGSEETDSVLGRTEPDAVLSGAGWLVVLEAKYHSPLDEEYDQLGREFAVGFNEARKAGLNFRLLVLTAHTLQPKPARMSLVEGVTRAVTKAKGDWAAEMNAAIPTSLLWAKWQRLYRIFKTKASDPGHELHTQRLLADVCRLLELHGLVPYDTSDIEKAMQDWQSSGISEEAWASPLIYRSRTVVSLNAGWGEVMRLDASDLGALVWHPYSTVGPTKARRPEWRSVQLDDSESGSLQAIAWQPYQQGGNIP